MTPNEIARKTGRSPKTIRAVLRRMAAAGELHHHKHDRWHLTPGEGSRVLRYFRG